MIVLVAYLALMVGCVLVGFVLASLVAQAGRNETEARYRAMLHKAWECDEWETALGMEFEEWLAWLERKVERPSKEERAS